MNFELPTTPQDYVHRIGRTGRAGLEGDAISLVCVDEAELLAEIETLLRKPIPWEYVPGFEPDRNIRAEPIREIRRGGGRPTTGRAYASAGGSSGSAAGRSAPRRRPAGRPTEAARPAPAHRSAAAPAAGQRPVHNPGPRTYDRSAAAQPGANRQFVTMPGERIARNDSSS